MIGVKLISCKSSEGHPFTEIRITVCGDRMRFYLSRVPYVIDNTVYAREQVARDFVARQGRPIE